MSNLVIGSIDNQNPKKQEFKSFDRAVESWVRLCLFHIKQRNQLINQNNNKKTHEYSTK